MADFKYTYHIVIYKPIKLIILWKELIFIVSDVLIPSIKYRVFYE